MKKSLLLFIAVLFLIPVASWGQASGDYRSAASGNWIANATWEKYDGLSWIAATAIPTNTDGVITIRNGHTVTISAVGLSYDQVTVDSGGQVTVASTITSTLADGTGTDLTINGTWLNQGGIWTTTGTWVVGSGGTYIHNTTSGIATPLGRATLDANSTFIYRGSSTLTPAISLSGRTYGNLSFESTSGSWTESGTGASALIINGNLSVGSNVTFNCNITGTPGHAVKGNFSVASGATLTFTPASAGTVSLNGSALQSISGAGTITTNASSTIAVNNSNGISLGKNLLIGGTLAMTQGNIALGGNTITLGLSGTTITTTGNTTISSTSITSVGSTAGVVVGMSITGTNIPTGATITAFTANTITLSANATATSTGVTLTINSIGNTLTYTAGFLTGSGTFTRWFGTSAITIGTAAGQFPFGVSSNNRNVWVGGTPTTGGTVSVQYADASGATQPFTSGSFSENSQTFVNRSNASWTVATANSFADAGAGLSLRIQGTGLPGINAVGDLNISGAAASASGTYAAPGGTTTDPQVNRTGLDQTGLTSTFYFASTSNSPLPVELTSFTRSIVGKKVILNWQTATEVNNYGFEIQRSAVSH